MIQEEIKGNLSEIKDEFTDYIENRINLTKLHLVETFSKISAGFVVKLSVLYLLQFAIMFFSLALAFFLGSLFSSNSLGFSVVACIYVLLAILLYAVRHKLIEKPIIKTYIHLFFPNFDNDENKK